MLLVLMLAVWLSATTAQGDATLDPDMRCNAFALDLYAQLREPTGENLAYSPLSTMESLAMAYAGARAETRAQMARVLHLEESTNESQVVLSRGLGALAAMRDAQGIHVRAANRVWVQSRLDLLPTFDATLRSVFQTFPGRADFIGRPRESLSEINHWVEDQTSGQVRDLLTPADVSEQTRLMLTNAIVFEGQWEKPFNPKQTRPAPFRVSSKTTIDVPFMIGQSSFPYGKFEYGEILRMPYGGGQFAMSVLLPADTEGGLDRLERALNPRSLAEWEKSLASQDVIVVLPRFQATRRYDLPRVLAAMGMPLAFGREADFSGITTNERLSLGSVVHEAMVSVNEAGTQAYGASAVAVEARILPPMFRADRPFLFLITERASGTILFMGRIVSPSSPK